MRIIATNKRASFDYTLFDRYEAGIVLSGQEVKSAKSGHASLKNSFITLKGSEPYLTNAHISAYKYAGKTDIPNPTRPRKLLLHKKEVSSLIGKSQTQGFSLIPLKLYVSGKLVKIEFALARGKKQYDKRQDIAKRETQKKISRALREK